MSRGPATFRQSDVERAIAACQRRGVRRYRVEAEHGKVVVIIDDDEAKVSPSAEGRGWGDV